MEERRRWGLSVGVNGGEEVLSTEKGEPERGDR